MRCQSYQLLWNGEVNIFNDMSMDCFFAGSLEDRLHYFETLHHDSLRHRITKRDVEDKPHGRILEYDSHSRSV